jgi:hypothetical protein
MADITPEKASLKFSANEPTSDKDSGMLPPPLMQICGKTKTNQKGKLKIVRREKEITRKTYSERKSQKTKVIIKQIFYLIIKIYILKGGT